MGLELAVVVVAVVVVVVVVVVKVVDIGEGPFFVVVEMGASLVSMMLVDVSDVLRNLAWRSQ